jgi:glycosyltransferase involved in cell wall biosynthesis
LSFPGDFLHYLELEPLMKPRLALVTAGHLSTCPRILKAADALAADGHDVVLVSTSSTDWAEAADADVRARRRGRFRVETIDYSRARSPLLHLKSGLRRRLARSIASRSKVVSFPQAVRAFARVHEELASAAAATSADFFYGGTTGGIAATFEAARRTGRPYALDLEDFFSGEPPKGSLDEKLASLIEREILPGARFLTASSGPIAEAYARKYGVEAETIHNVFPLPDRPPDLELSRAGPLRLYWFSQTIGPGRGLEDAVEAAGLSGVEAVLSLRGRFVDGYQRKIEELVKEKAPKLSLALHPPGPPDEMVNLAREFEVGISLEPGGSLNNQLAFGNKVLTYLLAGLALAMTNMPGPRLLEEELGGRALVVTPGDVKALAEGFRRFASDRRYLLECREASWNAAARRWHWEHSEESGKLRRLFAAAIR